jgi:hypothetical protein
MLPATSFSAHADGRASSARRRARDVLERLRAPDTAPLLVVLALAFAFYVWTASSSGNPIDLGARQHDYFNQLTDSFLHGDTSLDQKPPQALLDLPDPYDPAANETFRDEGGLHDLSLYHGRLYLYWGPTPSLTLFLPWRLLPFGDMPQNLAAVLFAIAGLGFALLLLRFLVRRYLPRTPPWQLTLAAIGLAAGNAAPFLLRRPVHYEVALTAGYCFTWAALWLLATGILGERRRPRRLVVASVCLGLAVGARPDLVLIGALAVLAWVVWIRRDGLTDWRPRVETALVLLGPFAAIVLLLLVYNAVRFNSPLEFGQRYQLAGVEVSKKAAFQAAYIPPGVYYYLLAPVRWTFAFPFFRLPPPPLYPGSTPVGYDGVEPVGGLVAAFPLLLILFAAPLALRGKIARDLGWVMGLLVALGLLLAVLIAFTLWGATERYELDFATLLILPAFLTWFALARLPRAGPVVAVVGTLAIAYGALVGGAVSFTGYYDNLRNGQPGTYRSLEDLTSPLPTLATIILGHPVITDVFSPTGGVTSKVNYGTLSAGRPDVLIGGVDTQVEIVSPDTRRVGLGGTFSRLPGTPPRAKIVVLAQLGAQRPSFLLTDGPHALSLKLHRGINRVSLNAISATSGAARPQPVPPGSLATIQGLVLTPAPR